MNTLLCYPQTPTYFFSEPISFAFDLISREVSRLQTIFNEVIFLSSSKSFIPSRELPEVILDSAQFEQLKIKKDGFSERIALTGQRFRCKKLPHESYKVTLIGDEQSVVSTSPEAIIWNELLAHTAALIKTISLALLYVPILPFTCAASYISKPAPVLIVSPQSSAESAQVLDKLRVEEWGVEQYAHLAKITRSWQRIAYAKNYKAQSIDPSKAALFSSAKTISKLASECLESPKECARVFDRAHICKDEEERVQAVALTSNRCVTFIDKKQQRDYLKLAHLVTHPRNIRSSVNEKDQTRTKGAATALIKKLALECIVTNKSGIYAEVTHVSRGFYEKLGFKRIPQKSVDMLEPSQIPMILSIEKIKQMNLQEPDLGIVPDLM